MKTVVAALSALCIASLATAQSDRIVWTDGTVTKDCRVTNYTVTEVTFSSGGRSETRSSDQVASLEVEKVRDTFKRAYGASNDDEAYSAFRNQIDKLGSKPFLAQFGYVEAARMLMKNQQYDQAFALLEAMVAGNPAAGFAPELYRMKLDHYLSMGEAGARNAGAVAQKFNDAAIKQAWPDGYVSEAAFYKLMARAAGGELTGAALQSELSSLLGQTESAYPGVADRVKIQLAHAQRAQNQLDQAEQTYREVLEKEGIGSDTRAQAFLGLGYVKLQAGDPSNTEPYYEAMLAFLRVYLNEGASSDARAEALYNASQAADKWRGPDSGAMARRLRGFLRRDFADSPWAKR